MLVYCQEYLKSGQRVGDTLIYRGVRTMRRRANELYAFVKQRYPDATFKWDENGAIGHGKIGEIFYIDERNTFCLYEFYKQTTED